WEWKWNYRRARAAARATARVFRTSWGLRSVDDGARNSGAVPARREDVAARAAVISRAQYGSHGTRTRLNGEYAGSGEERGEGLGVQRVADPVALGEVAAALAQDRVLTLLLHTYRDDRDAQ